MKTIPLEYIISGGALLYKVENKQHGQNINELGFTKLKIINRTLIQVVYLHSDSTNSKRTEYLVFEIKISSEIIEKKIETIICNFLNGFGSIIYGTGSKAEYDTFKEAALYFFNEINKY